MASLKRWLDRRRNPWKGVFYDAYRQFRADKAQARLHDLDFLRDGDVVLDFGGFRGEWTANALKHAAVISHVFEPHPRFFRELETRFSGNPDIHLHDFALGGKDGHLRLSDAGDASSAVAGAERAFDAPIRAVGPFFDVAGIQTAALAKINIEGGEYDLLPALIDSGVIDRIERLHVQFHLFAPEFSTRRDAIREALSRTHDCDWVYPFVWEAWHRRP